VPFEDSKESKLVFQLGEDNMKTRKTTPAVTAVYSPTAETHESDVSLSRRMLRHMIAGVAAEHAENQAHDRTIAEMEADAADHYATSRPNEKQNEADRAWQQDQWERDWLEYMRDSADSALGPVRRGVHFFTRERMPVKAYVEGFIYAGALNALIGPAKVGKSTLAWAMLDAAMNGKEFLGTRCSRSRVLYVSEQGEVSFEAQIKKLPLELSQSIQKSPNFFALLPEHHNIETGNPEHPTEPATTWNQRSEIWAKAIQNPKIRPDIFVLDTFSSYADLPFGGENDNSLLSQRLFELQRLKQYRPALAILVLHHSSKASERRKNVTYLPLSAVRGGSAFVASLDHVVTINKTSKPGAEISNVRYCYRQSRLTEEAYFTIGWQPDGKYGLVEGTAAVQAPVRQRVEEACQQNPELLNMSIRKMEAELNKMGIEVGRTTCQTVQQDHKTRKEAQ
jgi:AAA domain